MHHSQCDSRRFVLWLAAVSLLLCSSHVRGDYEKAVRPILKEYCFSCHGPKAQKGKLTLHTLDPDIVNGKDAEHWQEVLNQLNVGDMPPKEKPQPTAIEQQAVIDWITDRLQHARKVAQQRGAKHVIRRLNRAEYRNTIRDLTGLHLGPWFDPTARFTTDTATDGLDNIGSGLLVSDLHIQNYLAAAKQVVDALVADPDEPLKRVHWRIEPLYRQGAIYVPTSGDRREREAHKAFLAAEMERIKPRRAEKDMGRFDGRIHKHEFRQGAKETKDYVVWDMTANPPIPYMDFKDIAVRVSRGAGGCGTNVENAHRLIVRHFMHDPGLYRIRVRSQAFLPDGWDGRSPQMNFFLHPERVRLHDTTLEPKDESHDFLFYREGWQTLQQSMQQRSWGIEIGFPYQAGDKKNRIPWGGHIEWVEIEGPLYEQWPPAPHRSIFLPARIGESEAQRAERILRRFMTKAFRRPAEDTEVESMVAMYLAERQEGATFEGAMKAPLVAVLASPHFLYLVEPNPQDGKRRQLNDYELAARLSYFLWSSMPDDTLFALAAKGQLSQPKTLREQVTRMLADPKSKSLIKNFTGQWLGLRNLATVQPDQDLFPEFDPLLEASMIAETQRFFEEILRHDLSVLNLLHSDFTMLNERLAWHYGITGIRGNHFRRVALRPEQRPGGLLTQASILTIGSDGFRTLPVNRGVFVLDALLGDPPPPPPPNAGTLEDLVIAEADKLSTAKLLELHRRNSACAACHAKIDPWGMAFEGYDPIGRERTHELKWHAKKRRAIQGSPVTTAGTLADGRQINGPADVNKYLLQSEDEFLDSLAEKLLAYALGRRVTLADATLVEDLRRNTKRDGYRLRSMIENIVLSDAFRMR